MMTKMLSFIESELQDIDEEFIAFIIQIVEEELMSVEDKLFSIREFLQDSTVSYHLKSDDSSFNILTPL